jgi:hypothetical protein
MSQSSDAPSLTPEERELIALQTEMLRDSQSAAEQSAQLTNLLAPILLREAGFELQTATEDIRNPEYDALQQRFREVSRQVNELERQYDVFNFQEKNPGQELPLVLKEIGDDFTRGNVKGPGGREWLRNKASQLQSEYNSLRQQLEETPEFTQRVGDFLGVTPLDELPAEALSPEERRQREIDAKRQEIELRLLEREEAALRGELPVNPALLSDLEEQEESLRAQLAQQLGPGFETSTPAIQALAEFEQRKQEILENARRGDLGFAQQLANNMGGFSESVSGSDFAKTGDILGQQFGVAANLANVSQAFTGPLSFMQNERFSQFQASQQPGVGETLALLMAGQAAGGLGAGFGKSIADLFKD